MSLALALLFLLMLLICLAKHPCVKSANEGGWILKILIVIALFILFQFVPNSFFFNGYLTFCKVIGFIFIIFEFIMLIDLFWMWGERWVEKFD